MLYKPGDVVVVRTDLESWHTYGDVGFVGSMEGKKGESVHISKCIVMKDMERGGYYRIEEDNGIWAWSEEMFVQREPNEESEFDDSDLPISFFFNE